MNADKQMIQMIFNTGRRLEIPFFQRSYVWEKENWERFLEDMKQVSELDKKYFLGTLLFKQKSDVASHEFIGDVRVVIDGQQRLTTLILLFKAAPDEYTKKLFYKIFFNINNEIILKHNYNDYEIFEAIVYEKVDERLEEKYRENRVLKCFNYFKNEKNILEKINFNVLLNNLFFVVIDLTPEEDEQEIFDTMNSLGVSLSAAELLKNELYKREDEKLYSETWKKTFENDEETRNYWNKRVTSGRQSRANIDLLLQSYLLIVSDAESKFIGIGSLFSKYKKYIKNNNINKEIFVDKLIKYANIYRGVFDTDLLNQDIDVNSPSERLNIVIFGLNMTTVIPYILYTFEEVENKEERNKMLDLLEAYLIRRLVCKLTTKNYNNLFASFIRNKIDSYEKLYEKIMEGNDETTRFPSNEELSNAFLENKLTNQQAKVVLYLIEKRSRDYKKNSTDIKPFNEYSLEHIMPKKWRDYWEKPKEITPEKRDQLILTLGNLTIITASLNKSIKNASWKIKKDGIGDKKGLKKYSSGISIFEDYLDSEEWDDEKIMERGRALSELAKEIWKSDI